MCKYLLKFYARTNQNSDQSNMSNDNDMDMDSNIREEQSINEKNYIKVRDWDQLSIKMKENLPQLQFCLGQVIGKTLQ